jgi:hypothetical protein
VSVRSHRCELENGGYHRFTRLIRNLCAEYDELRASS